MYSICPFFPDDLQLLLEKAALFSTNNELRFRIYSCQVFYFAFLFTCVSSYLDNILTLSICVCFIRMKGKNPDILPIWVLNVTILLKLCNKTPGTYFHQCNLSRTFVETLIYDHVTRNVDLSYIQS